jgi:hypothetical protein
MYIKKFLSDIKSFKLAMLNIAKEERERYPVQILASLKIGHAYPPPTALIRLALSLITPLSFHIHCYS